MREQWPSYKIIGLISLVIDPLQWIFFLFYSFPQLEDVINTRIWLNILIMFRDKWRTTAVIVIIGRVLSESCCVPRCAFRYLSYIRRPDNGGRRIARQNVVIRTIRNLWIPSNYLKNNNVCHRIIFQMYVSFYQIDIPMHVITVYTV